MAEVLSYELIVLGNGWWGVAVDVEVGLHATDTPTTCRHAGGAGVW